MTLGEYIEGRIAHINDALKSERLAERLAYWQRDEATGALAELDELKAAILSGAVKAL